MAIAAPSSASAGGGPLRDGDTAVVIGGGPAGAFFAIHLLREARRLDRRIDLEQHGLTVPEDVIQEEIDSVKEDVEWQGTTQRSLAPRS